MSASSRWYALWMYDQFFYTTVCFCSLYDQFFIYCVVLFVDHVAFLGPPRDIVTQRRDYITKNPYQVGI